VVQHRPRGDTLRVGVERRRAGRGEQRDPDRPAPDLVVVVRRIDGGHVEGLLRLVLESVEG
jgi:hypothetical protein